MITTIGIFSTQTDANNALNDLRTFGVKNEDISLLSGKNIIQGCIEKLTSFGIHDRDITRFQDYIRSGDSLVIVRVKSFGQKEILVRAHAREVQEYM